MELAHLVKHVLEEYRHGGLSSIRSRLFWDLRNKLQLLRNHRKTKKYEIYGKHSRFEICYRGFFLQSYSLFTEMEFLCDMALYLSAGIAAFDLELIQLLISVQYLHGSPGPPRRLPNSR